MTRLISSNDRSLPPWDKESEMYGLLGDEWAFDKHRQTDFQISCDPSKGEWNVEFGDLYSRIEKF